MRRLPFEKLKVPPRVRERLERIAEKTDLVDPIQLWKLQSLAVKLTADAELRRQYISTLTEREKVALRFNWKYWRRRDQIPPAGRWYIWLILAGRGWGKTRVGAQFVIERARLLPGSRGALVGPTAADVRDTMIEGESGILECSPPDFRPKYEPSKRRLTWPNGSRATAFTADKPERLRGPQFHWFWADELGAWRFVDYAWEMLQYGVRKEIHGEPPRGVITTTPRPIKRIQLLVKNAKKENVEITRGSSFANLFHLAARFFRQILNSLGSQLSLQEAFGILLDATEGALWSMALIELNRVDELPVLRRTVIGVDPADGETEDADEVGIIAAAAGKNEHGYVLGDYSLGGTPLVWAREALRAHKLHKADAIVVESNRGGKKARDTIINAVPQGQRPPRIILVPATAAKEIRAEPTLALYEIGRMHHHGHHAKLENEQTTWVPGKSTWSPNRIDALVHATDELFPHGEYQEAPAGGRVDTQSKPQGKSGSYAAERKSRWQ